MNVVSEARRRAGLAQAELASRAGTSRPTLSSYEHGRTSPTLATVERIVEAAGFALTIEPRPRFAEHALPRGRPVFVPDRLWRLPVDRALATVVLSPQLFWSGAAPIFDLARRHERLRCYEIVLREGMPGDLLRYVDGALLVDGWSEMVLPSAIRLLWSPVLAAACPG